MPVYTTTPSSNLRGCRSVCRMPCLGLNGRLRHHLHIYDAVLGLNFVLSRVLLISVFGCDSVEELDAKVQVIL